MRKFIVVGVGGSGGATVRYIMDQLRADLRARGVDSIPSAWQFLHVDVNPVPESTPGLGSIRDLGGRYIPISTAANTFESVRRQVESRLATANHLEGLLGWAPEPRDQARNVPVTSGAGQYRAVGRMLTLTRLDRIQEELQQAWQSLQQQTAWGDVPEGFPDQGPYDRAGAVLPIVIGSMAGGSGASMFLDVCRVLGRISGLERSNLGAYLFTPDVFHSLPKAARVGIDGNAMGVLGELLASQSRAGDIADNALMQALGLSPEISAERAFGRVFPIGATIGGDGAKFGETPDDVFRGLGRALAATMISELAASEYQKTRLENPAPAPVRETAIGWGAEVSEMSWGSVGYSSLSLGRDRYTNYVSQRLARIAADRLVDGFKRPGSALPPTEQLEQDVRDQWSTTIDRLGLPQTDVKASAWIPTVFDSRRQDELVRDALRGLPEVLMRADTGATGEDYFRVMEERFVGDQNRVAGGLHRGAYAWVEFYAKHLESTVREEILIVLSRPRQGLPYARKVVEHLGPHLRTVAGQLLAAPSPSPGPLSFPPNLRGVGKVDNSRQFRERAVADVIDGVKRELRLRVVDQLGRTLIAFVEDVLPALARALSAAHRDLESAMESVEREAGIAQLHTSVYREWPVDDVIPPRFAHAHNEVLLTTAADFPPVFRAHVESAQSEGNYAAGIEEMVEQIVRGRWDDVGAAPTEFAVLTNGVNWRPQTLPTDAATGEFTQPTAPEYDLDLSPKALLERATAFQARKGQSFADFSNQTFAAYLDEPGLADSAREHRRRRFVDKFAEAVSQAQPLVGVSARMIQTLHTNTDLELQLTFSDVPLGPGTPAAHEVRELLSHTQYVAADSVERFEQALTSQNSTNRIAIHGSYPKYAPLAFTSIFEQLQNRWSGASGEDKRELWKWKRTRPLPAALGMSPAEQLAMVKGWFLGRALGLLQHPATPKDPGHVQVFDVKSSSWRSFSDVLLTPRDAMRNGLAWLPAVLEGHTLAIIDCVNDEQLTALQPYRALRQLHHDGEQEELAGVPTSGEGLLVDWLRDGVWLSGYASEIDVIKGAGATPDERANALLEWSDTVLGHFRSHYVTGPDGPGIRSRSKLKVASVEDVTLGHLIAEMALVIELALVEFQKSVNRALERAHSGAGTDDIPQV